VEIEMRTINERKGKESAGAAYEVKKAKRVKLATTQREGGIWGLKQIFALCGFRIENITNISGRERGGGL